jgi:hypothetical protein
LVIDDVEANVWPLAKGRETLMPTKATGKKRAKNEEK